MWVKNTARSRHQLTTIVRAALTACCVLAILSPDAAAVHRSGSHWRTGNYACHRHSKRIWHGRKVGYKRTVCRYAPRRRNPNRWVLPRFVVLCESGGNPRAVNRFNYLRPAGLYQIITSTWVAYGGWRYAPTADRASIYEQGVVALRVLNGQGYRAWECWRRAVGGPFDLLFPLGRIEFWVVPDADLGVLP